MNYSENYLKGANMLDSEMEQFDHNPADYVEAMGWTTKALQEKANAVKGKLELVKNDYLFLEEQLNRFNGNTECDEIKQYVSLIFAQKIGDAIF